MVSLYRDPQGKRVFDEKGSTTGDTYSTNLDKSKIASLEQEILSLRTSLQKYKAEIIKILMTMRCDTFLLPQ